MLVEGRIDRAPTPEELNASRKRTAKFDVEQRHIALLRSARREARHLLQTLNSSGVLPHLRKTSSSTLRVVGPDDQTNEEEKLHPKAGDFAGRHNCVDRSLRLPKHQAKLEQAFREPACAGADKSISV